MTTETRRREIIDCLHNWKTSYKITGNQLVIDKSISELVGENQAIWFNYSEANEFDSNEECNQIGFDAKNALMELLAIKNQVNPILSISWNDIRSRVFNGLSKGFSNDMNSITGETDPSVKKDKLIRFIKKCEKCYVASQNDAFVGLAKQAKKIDLELNGWIQAKAYPDVESVNNLAINDIGDNFIRLIADPKITEIKLPPPYFIEREDDENSSGLKKWYLKYGWQTHLIAFVIIGGLFYWKFQDFEFIWLVEGWLVILLINLLIVAYFRFFYRERIR